MDKLKRYDFEVVDKLRRYVRQGVEMIESRVGVWVRYKDAQDKIATLEAKITTLEKRYAELPEERDTVYSDIGALRSWKYSAVSRHRRNPMNPPSDHVEAEILIQCTEEHPPAKAHMIADLMIERLLIRLGFSETATAFSKLRTRTMYYPDKGGDA